MKKIVILLTAIVLVAACNQKEKNKDESTEKTEAISNNETVENFDWLTGKWRRLNEESGKETFENWDKISAMEYSGIGSTMQNGDTISQERMKIVQQDFSAKLLIFISVANTCLFRAQTGYKAFSKYAKPMMSMYLSWASSIHITFSMAYIQKTFLQTK